MSSSSDHSGKNILLGVCGGIAAYKSAYLVREFIKKGYQVKVLMTNSAKDFVGPLTFSTLSKNPVHSDLFDPISGEWVNHVELGAWADLMVIAPATANTISKAANGQSDNLLLTTYLSAKSKVLWVPAMDLDMLKHPATEANFNSLRQYGNEVMEPASGELASGLEGKGRMPEPEEIFKRAEEILRAKKSPPKKKSAKRILVTAGPTYEAIDPVRFLGNRSSGKMGFAIAETLAELGFEVELITGPTVLTSDHPSIRIQRIESAEEMKKAAVKTFKKCNGAILSAAVADYKPKNVFREKKKKLNGKPMDLELVETADIALSLKEVKSSGQFIVGFALETQNELENARKKMDRKGFDMIVLNSLKDEGAGFQGDTNKVTILKVGEKKPMIYGLKSKKEVSIDIVNQMQSLL